MSNKFTDAAINAFLAQYSTAWISLHYNDPGLGTYQNYEVTGGSYNRQLGTFTVPSGRTIWLSAPVQFNGLPAVNITHIGFWTDQYAGTLFAVAAAPNAPIAIAAGGTFNIAQNDLALSIN